MRSSSVIKVFVAVAAFAALVFGVWMGLLRIGWIIDAPPAPGTHGPMLVLGFLGTVIGMERAVALAKPWAWISSATSALAVVAMLAGWPAELAGALLLVGGGVLVWVFVTAYRIQPESHIVLMGIGAVAWVLAAATWLAGNPVPSLVPWLAAFLVLTIAGERLELARLIATTAAAKRLLFGAVGVALAGSAIAWASPEFGARIAGLGNLLIAVWLIRFDIARRTIRLGGVTRYMAAGLLLGYVWLAVSGVFWMLSGLSAGASTYDAALHTLFLGFVMSMIMAHAPIVIPALAGLAFPFHPSLWVPLILFHVTVVIRVAGGLTGSFEVKKWGAMLNAIVLTLFLLQVAATVVRGEHARRANTR